MKVEHVRSRVADLAGRNYDNPLPVLAEIRFYHDKGYLSKIETATAYKAILGPEGGTALAEGTPSERLTFLETWLPVSATSSR